MTEPQPTGPPRKPLHAVVAEAKQALRMRFGPSFSDATFHPECTFLTFRSREAARDAATHFWEAGIDGSVVILERGALRPRSVSWPPVTGATLMQLLFLAWTGWTLFRALQ